MKRISIIIPVHNVEEYLEKCLNSIIFQINEQDEIILINDNSQDSSEEICKKFAEQYNNVKFENGAYGGPSKTRNIGIKMATGKYIMFVDSDDYLKNNYISRMIKDIEKYELRVCSYYFEYPDIKKIKPQKYDEEKTENETIEIMKDDFITLYSRQLLNLVWNKIYYANIIKENNILFDENVTKGEDLLFNLEYIKHINTNIAVINEPLYYYVSKKTGLNRSFKEPIEDRLKRTENVYKKMKAISEKNNNVIISEIINMYFIHLRNYISENKIKHNINKEFANKLDRPEIREMLDNIKNNEIPNLKFVKKLYYNKKIIFMFLYNKLNLKLSKRSIKREEITK
ncbi:MAG: glycosyltransferase family 2 protein [Clostridium sp.]|nr:glycosyltransferase family 2 protein [Clostridium sp.]